MELFPSLMASASEAFCKNSQKLRAVYYFYKNLHHGYLRKFCMCFWVGLRMFHFLINLNIGLDWNALLRVDKIVEKKNQNNKRIIQVLTHYQSICLIKVNVKNNNENNSSNNK